jgi:hypothetical protein
MTGQVPCYNPIFIRHTGDHLYLVVILVLLASLSFAPLSSAVADTSELMKLISENEDIPSILQFHHQTTVELMKLISENEDIPITVNDLAFFLVIHDFDAAPKKDHVEVRLNSTVYKLVPNGPYPGLANVTKMS